MKEAKVFKTYTVFVIYSPTRDEYLMKTTKKAGTLWYKHIQSAWCFPTKEAANEVMFDRLLIVQEIVEVQATRPYSELPSNKRNDE